MAPRANWKGYLKLSLVSCGVALFPATSTSQRIRFNIINRETGNRVRYQQVDSATGDEVPPDDRVKGYKTSNGSYVLLEDDELDEVALESTHTIEIEAFVPRDEVDEIYLDESSTWCRTTRSASRRSPSFETPWRPNHWPGWRAWYCTGASAC